MLTHVVSEWARGLGKDIWMNIDISLAPCGVSAGGTRACKTLTKERSPPVTEIFLLFYFFFPTRMQYSTLFLWTEIKVNHCCYMWHSKLLRKVDQVTSCLALKLRIQTNWDRIVCKNIIHLFVTSSFLLGHFWDVRNATCSNYKFTFCSAALCTHL